MDVITFTEVIENFSVQACFEITLMIKLRQWPVIGLINNDRNDRKYFLEHLLLSGICQRAEVFDNIAVINNYRAVDLRKQPGSDLKRQYPKTHQELHQGYQGYQAHNSERFAEFPEVHSGRNSTQH